MIILLDIRTDGDYSLNIQSGKDINLTSTGSINVNSTINLKQ